MLTWGLIAAASTTAGSAGTTGGGSHVSNLAAFATLVGALGVALITWYATDRRQKNALADERVRLEAQLAHARALSDLGELRAVLDDTLLAIEQQVSRIGRFEQARSLASASTDAFDGLAQEQVRLAEVAQRAAELKARAEQEAQASSPGALASGQLQSDMLTVLGAAGDFPDIAARIQRASDEMGAAAEVLRAVSQEVQRAVPDFNATIARLRLRLIEDPLLPLVGGVQEQVAALNQAAMSGDREAYAAAQASYSDAHSSFVDAAAQRVRVLLTADEVAASDA